MSRLSQEYRSLEPVLSTAEGTGFEPVIPFPGNRISSAAHSTALPTLLNANLPYHEKNWAASKMRPGVEKYEKFYSININLFVLFRKRGERQRFSLKILHCHYPLPLDREFHRGQFSVLPKYP